MASLSSINTFVSSLPDHCDPTNPFLRHFSAYFHTCIPTPLAFLSTALGTLSIASWLFAQLPQIYKNYKVGSTSGLSIFFLVEWCLGDMSNLLGAKFTDQATWQIIIAGYYVFVDVVLVGQWFWYEKLKHGKNGKIIWWARKDTSNDRRGGRNAGVLVEGIEPLDEVVSAQSNTPKNKKDRDDAQSIEQITILSSEKVWKTPDYGSITTNGAEKLGEITPSSSSSSPRPRSIYRTQPSNSPLAIATPKTFLFLSLLLALIQVHASPAPRAISPFAAPLSLSLSLSSSSPHHPSTSPPPSTTTHTTTTTSSSPTVLAGTLLSWLSTLLYLGSRLPQLLKNLRRRSTAGLSPALFLAAFFGNLFYSSSLLSNPCAWSDYGAYGGGGWVGGEGSARAEWVGRALPFFLGAAGVLALDAAVGVQFLVYGEGGRKATEVVVEVERGGEGEMERGVGREEAAQGVADALEEAREARRAVPIRIQGVGDRAESDGGGEGGDDVLALERPSSWQRVTGWMRGWVPSPQQRVVVKGQVRHGGNENDNERQALLRREEWASDGED